MTTSVAKIKRGNSVRKYPGKLGRRRKLSSKLERMFDWYAAGALGDPSIHVEGEDLRTLMQQSYMSEGVELLCRHFRITATDPTAVMAAIALHLMRVHVPYFMPPTRSTGRPRKLAAMFPMLNGLMSGRADGRVKLSAEGIYGMFANFLGVDPETIEREYRKWLKSRRGKLTPN
jgi:hypothetical protein